MKDMLSMLEEKYNTIARKVLSGKLSNEEYESAIESLRELEMEMFKLQFLKSKK